MTIVKRLWFALWLCGMCTLCFFAGTYYEKIRETRLVPIIGATAKFIQAFNVHDHIELAVLVSNPTELTIEQGWVQVEIYESGQFIWEKNFFISKEISRKSEEYISFSMYGKEEVERFRQGFCVIDNKLKPLPIYDFKFQIKSAFGRLDKR